MKALVILCASALAGMAPLAGALAKEKTDTPSIIEVVTEDAASKAGDGLADLLRGLKHLREADGLRWIGATVVVGDLNRTVAIFEQDNYAALPAVEAALHAAWQALPEGQRPSLTNRVYALAPEQSYNDGHVGWNEAGAFSLLIHEVRVGGGDDYREQQSLAAKYLRKAQVLDEEWLGFSEVYGPGKSFAFVTPLKSIAALDALTPHGNPFPAQVDRRRQATLLKTVSATSTTLLQVRPDLSQRSR